MSSRAQKGRQSCSGASVTSVSMAFLDSGGSLVSPQGIRPWGPQAAPQPFLWLLWSDVLPGQVNPQECPTNKSTNRVPNTNGPRHSRRFGEREGSHRPHMRHLYNAQAAGGIQVPPKPSNINLVFKSLFCLFVCLNPGSRPQTIYYVRHGVKNDQGKLWLWVTWN